MHLVAVLVRAVGAAVRPVDRHGASSRQHAVILSSMLAALGLTAGCAGLNPPASTPVVVVVTAPPVVVTAPPPSPIVVVVTATPGPQAAQKPAAGSTPAPVAASKPGGSPTAVVAQAKPTGPVPTATVAAQTLRVGRTNAYRGLNITVEEARSDQKIEGETARSGQTLVGLRVKAENPTGLLIHFSGGPLGDLAKLKLPDGSTVQGEAIEPLYRPSIKPHDSLAGWLIFRVNRPAPLESMALALGGGAETVVTIPFSGPEPKIATRTFEYLRSTEPVRGLIWSVSGGELRLDVPGQQANPGQEFIVVNVRATNPTANTVSIKGPGSIPQEGHEYLRVRADNGVLLQVSAELSKLPTEFPGKAEQDTQYAWQLPMGSKNPRLVILSPDGSEHEIELGPLPPP